MSNLRNAASVILSHREIMFGKILILLYTQSISIKTLKHVIQNKRKGIILLRKFPSRLLRIDYWAPSSNKQNGFNKHFFDDTSQYFIWETSV